MLRELQILFMADVRVCFIDTLRNKDNLMDTMSLVLRPCGAQVLV